MPKNKKNFLFTLHFKNAFARIYKCEQFTRGRGGMVDATDLRKIEPYGGNLISVGSQIQGNLSHSVIGQS
ncbi:MAG: hypothetical protein D6822_08160 [Cyanobacteria bacterium J149]|nr:MAG: hypothetical protein D6822_08160 [Cyanobacteria bacterium J149]